jgi:ribosomal protein L6P/L9E
MVVRCLESYGATPRERRALVAYSLAWPLVQVTFGIDMEEGVEVARTTEKDEISLIGNSLEAVGTSVSNIQQTCQVKKKDIRKFLDGIYRSSRQVIGQD